MSVQEATISKIQQMPDSLVKEVQDYIDFLLMRHDSGQWEMWQQFAAETQSAAKQFAEKMQEALPELEPYNARLKTEEVGRIGEAIYCECLRESVMPQHKGKFLVLDIATRDYEIDADVLFAEDRLRERHPDGQFYGIRIGYLASHTLGGSLPEDTE